MSLTGINFAILATISWSLCIFPFTLAARKLGSVPLNHFRLLLAVILIGITSILILPEDFLSLFHSDFVEAWFWLGISGIIGLTIGDHFGFAMYAILGPRIGSILTTFAPAATLIVSYLILGEELSMIGIFGMFITIAGVIWLSLSRGERHQIPDRGHGSIRRGIIYGVLAAICQGAGLVLAKRGMLAEFSAHEAINPVHATFMRLSIATISLYLFSFIRNDLRNIIKSISKNNQNGIKNAVTGTLFGPVLGVALSLYAVAQINASIAQTIYSLVPVFALVISYFHLKEKINMRAILGVIVAISGVFILIWREQLKALF